MFLLRQLLEKTDYNFLEVFPQTAFGKKLSENDYYLFEKLTITCWKFFSSDSEKRLRKPDTFHNQAISEEEKAQTFSFFCKQV